VLLRRELRASAPPLRRRSREPHRRVGCYGLSWDSLGVKSVAARRCAHPADGISMAY